MGSDESFGPQPASDVYAEQGLLGLVLLAPDQCGDALLSLAPDDWYRPAHRILAGVLTGMLRSGQSVDPVTVFGQIQAQGLSRNWDAVKLVTLTQMAGRAESAADLANRIRELSGRRKLSIGAQRAVQRLETLDESDGGAEVRTITAELRAMCDVAEDTAADRTMPAPTAMADFLTQRDERHWLVPGLLERMDRTVITGAEGGGKSVLCSQIAATLAGGVHPFGGNVLGDGKQSVRVLVLDCENSPSQSRRRYRWVIERVKAVREMNGFNPVDWNEQMQIDMRPQGIDLLGRKDVAWIEHSINVCAPDLLVLGPLYKLHTKSSSDEEAARELAWVLDGLRERYGFALLTEAHAAKTKDQVSNKRVMDPIGSSLWKRWPEFGFGLSRADDDPGVGRASIVDVLPWRGAREERAWPNKLHQGDTLPWLPDGDYFETMNDYI
ncbi:hypothetical protein CH253_08330 [Rhodococcus sp. 06-156-3C]|uniref:ATP-binding protein n=1 Tax=Rhodococcus sp. 06-156-3C TaxID=2022486 RepID=UPI000B9A3D43|nr:AAA family ATPase [Rhodococcus sp. 06-156-3C]OZD23853.1 hypothetical protein CH253_08330 [Rhodococcus sp. 06-156-3C]